MAERMFGLETEYAIAGIQGHKRINRDFLMIRFTDAARRSLVHLPDAGLNGMFLANGSRLYIDCGQHPELATPECTNPWDAVRYLKAGEMIIGAVIKQLSLEGETPAEIFCSACNVDYMQNTTWGCHESFLHQCDMRKLSRHIIPHLVTRTIFTGAGGFDALSAGLRFTLSPRAFHIGHVSSCSSTADRGIYHTKNEPLNAKGYHRLHILCGESQRSELAIWLKVGTTAVVVAMIEAGLQPACDFELASPVNALHTIAADTHCKEKLELVGGRTASAIDIQRRYLNLAESHQNDSFMPPWTYEVCSRWRKVLDLLAESPAQAHRMLDWAIKHALYTRYIQNRGVQWETINAWSDVVGKLQAALKENRHHRRLNPDFLLGPNSPVLEEVAQLTPYIGENGLRWDGLEDFFKLKQEMFEIDTRFGQLGERGIFQSLEREGMLEHHVDGVDNIEYAVSHPPDSGRARIRGETVRCLAGKSGNYICNWFEIRDHEGNAILDLSDPFAAKADSESIGGNIANVDNQPRLPFLEGYDLFEMRSRQP